MIAGASSSTTAAALKRQALLNTADSLDVTPVYNLYLGTQDYRARASCSSTSHAASGCTTCANLSISLMPALLAVSHLVHDSVSTYERSLALKGAFDNAEEQASWLGAIDAHLTDDLREFLTEPQTGARAVARSLVDRVLHVRAGQFQKHVTELVHTEHLGAVFPDAPGDEGPFGTPYLPHLLRGLVHAPPD